MRRVGGRAEAGAVALLAAITAMAVTVAVAGMLAIAIDLHLAAARARTAADAAALAAMAASPLVGGDGDVRHAATALAAVNGGRLSGVDLAAWPLRVGVTVVVEPRLAASRLAPPLRARAVAQLRPRSPPGWTDGR